MDAVDVIVGFWAGQIKTSVEPSPQVEGSARALMVQLQRKRRATVTPEQVERFRVALDASARTHPHLSFGVDYQPDAELVDACNKADIEWEYLFTVKTWTHIHDGVAYVARNGKPREPIP